MRIRREGHSFAHSLTQSVSQGLRSSSLSEPGHGSMLSAWSAESAAVALHPASQLHFLLMTLHRVLLSLLAQRAGDDNTALIKLW